MDRPGKASGWVRVGMMGLFGLVSVVPLDAQTNWEKLARDAVRSTGLGTSVLRTTAEAQLVNASRIELDGAGLPTVSVGALTLGISAVEIRNGTALRLHAYLYNPGVQATSVPVPDPGLFVLVDAQGRRLQLLGGPDVDGLEKGVVEIAIPALERVGFTLLYDEIANGALLGTLKVGQLGMISGIPLNTSASAVGTGVSGAAGNVWTSPPAPVPPDPGSQGAPHDIVEVYCP